MAGIITDVSEDIQKLQRLKAEIADVKKELKGIDIRVRLDLKEEIEARLQSLMKQYNEVVLRIAKVEGEAMLAAKKIDEAINGISSDPLKSFDAELLKMCSNLNTYFDGLLAKVESMTSLLQVGKAGIDGSNSNNIPTQQLEELRSKNLELTEQLRAQKDEIKQQQEEWNKLATALKSNNVSAIEQYKQATNSSSDAVKSAKAEQKGLTKDLNENIKYYDTLAAQIASYNSILERLYAAKNKGMTRVPIGDGATALISSELERFKPQLDDTIQKSKEIALQISDQRKRQAELNLVIEQGNEKHLRTRTLIMDAREQLIQMRAAGLQNTPQYQQASEELGRMRKQMVLVNSEMAYLSNPNKHLEALKTGLQGVAGSASLVVGVMGLFNQKNEEMTMIQTKIQSLLGIIIGLESAYNTVKKSSMVMRALENIQTRALIASQALEAKAKTTNIALTWSEVVAQKALNAVAKVNPYILLGTAILTVVGGMALLISANKKSTTEQERAHKTTLDLISAQNQLALAHKNAVSNSVKERTELNLLYNKLKDATITTKERSAAVNEWIKKYPQHASIMDGELVSLGKLDIAYQSLSKQIIASANARAIQDGIVENSKKRSEEMSNVINSEYQLIQKRDELSRRMKETPEGNYGSITISYDTLRDEIRDLEEKSRRSRDVILQIDLANKSLEKKIKVDDLFSQPKEGTYDYWEQQVQIADAALKQIDSKQKALLDNAVKDPKKDLYGLGIDKSIVDSYKQAIKLKAEAEKELKVYDSSTNQDSAAEKLRKEQEKYNLLMDKQSLEQKRSAEDLQMKVDESRITAMDEGSKKTIAEMELNFEKEMQVIDRQKEDTLRKKIEDARSVWEADPKNKKKSFDATGIKLSEEENKKYDALYKAQTESFEKEKLRTEALAMREYLKEYGTFQQQKLAIAEEYAEKIKNAQFESERLTLGKQRDAALLNIDVQAAKQDIDWQSIFGDLGMMLKEQIQPTIDNLKTVIQSKEFQNSSIEDQQKIFDLLSDLEKRSGTFGKDMFKDVSRDLQLFRNSLNAYNEAKQREIKAANELAVAQERLKMAQENGEDTTSAQQAVDDAQDAFNQVCESVKVLGEKASENANTLHSSSEKVRGALEGLVSGLDKLKSGSLQQAFDGVKDIGGVLSKVIGGKIGKAIENIDPTGIISGVLSILDILKDGFSSIFVSLQDTMYGAIEGILNDIYSGDIIVKPIQNALSHVGSILNTITFGGFNSIFGASGNSKEVNAIVGRLTESNKYLITAIDKLTDEMEKSGGKRSTEYYESAHEKQVQKVENDRQMLEAKMKYNSSHHSNDYYINKAFNADDWKKASDYVGVQMKQAGDLWKLSPEDLAKLQELPDIWNKIHSGKYDQSEWLDNYVEDADKLEELTEKWHESLNQTSLDTFKSGFLDTLMDMDSSSEDFAENFEEYLKKSILSALIADNYANEIEELYKEWAKAGEDGEYDEGEINRLRERQEKLSNKMLADRDALADAMGWESDSESTREATQKGIATASQDSVDENNGRLAVMQEHTFSINENVNRMAAGIDTIASHTANLSCLTSIDKTMQSLLTMRNEAVGHLSNIDNYTSNLVEMKQYMNSMKQDINTMLIKGLKLSKN